MNKLLSIRKCIQSFKSGSQGLKSAFVIKNSFKVHTLIAFIVAIYGIKQLLTGISWCWIILATGMVFGVELTNTTLEKVMDRVCPTSDPEVKKIKVLAAASVLITCLSAAGVSTLVF